MSSSQSLLSHYTPTTQISTLSLPDALPISSDNLNDIKVLFVPRPDGTVLVQTTNIFPPNPPSLDLSGIRSEEHTSELQSRENLVCRLLLEKKNNQSKSFQLLYHHIRYDITC